MGSIIKHDALPRPQSSLPWIPSDEQWRAVLTVAAAEPVRTRLMLALAYDAALRREELCSLHETSVLLADFPLVGPSQPSLSLQAPEFFAELRLPFHDSTVVGNMFHPPGSIPDSDRHCDRGTSRRRPGIRPIRSKRVLDHFQCRSHGGSPQPRS